METTRGVTWTTYHLWSGLQEPLGRGTRRPWKAANGVVHKRLLRGQFTEKVQIARPHSTRPFSWDLCCEPRDFSTIGSFRSKHPPLLLQSQSFSARICAWGARRPALRAKKKKGQNVTAQAQQHLCSCYHEHNLN
ncbi:unnamed protein product [Trichogramma brassicae]|uniref:Uncharacterized protein n=1 Tax=Trichogramma brassicae TaxID=86971 RepID=A0A6H5HS25_9HYME|nr:unnamed protein product [Trichogramma brassicae]